MKRKINDLFYNKDVVERENEQKEQKTDQTILAYSSPSQMIELYGKEDINFNSVNGFYGLSSLSSNKIDEFELQLSNIKCDFIAYSPELVEENLFCIIQYSSEKLTTYAKIMKVDLTMNEIAISYVKNNSLRGFHFYDLTTGIRHETCQIIKVEHKHNLK